MAIYEFEEDDEMNCPNCGKSFDDFDEFFEHTTVCDDES